jgi:hypothetical protein
MGAVLLFVQREGLLLQIPPHHLEVHPLLSHHDLYVVAGLPALPQEADYFINSQRRDGLFGWWVYKHGNG